IPQTPTHHRPNTRTSLDVSRFGLTLPIFDLTNSSLGTLHDLLQTRAVLAYDRCKDPTIISASEKLKVTVSSQQFRDWTQEMLAMVSVCEEWQDQMVERREELRKMGAPLSFAAWLDRGGRS
ncbi:MAG: hypothetical protein Q9226_007427, partial [Calogaya cf. arnoldii]